METTTSNAMAQAEQPTARNQPVHQALCDLDSALDTLGVLISRTEDDLGAILTPRLEEPALKEALPDNTERGLVDPAPTRSPTVRRIEQHTDQVRRLAQRVEAIRERIEA